MNLLIKKTIIYSILMLFLFVLCCGQDAFAMENVQSQQNSQQINIIDDQEIPQVIMPTNVMPANGFEFGWLIPFSLFAIIIVGGLLYYLCKSAKSD